jgi:hypothetical protein
MSQVSPGWYPDPSGRFVQRYHDGTRWTEHVADAHGNRDTDVPSRPARPASYPDVAPDHGQGDQRSSDLYGRRSASAQRGHGQDPGDQGYGHEATRPDRGYGQEATRPDRGYGQEATRPDRGYGQEATRSDRGYGQEATRSDRGYGQEATRPDRGRGQWGAQEQDWGQEPTSDQRYGEQGGETRWDQAGTGSWQGHAGPSEAGNQWPHDQGTGQQGGDGWAGDAAGGWGARADWQAGGQDRGPAGYGARYQSGQQGGYAPAPAYGQQGYGDARSRSSQAFTPTIGLVVAGVGAVLLLLSLFGLNFLELSFPGLSRSISLSDIAGDFGDGAPAALATYADFGRFLAILVAALAILAVARVVPQLRDISALPAIAAVACGAFALWHVLAMLASAEEGVDVSPTFGAILGLLGYVALAAGPFLRQPLQAQRRGGG